MKKYSVCGLLILLLILVAGCGSTERPLEKVPVQVDPKAVYNSVYIAPHMDEAVVPNDTLIRYRIKFVPLGNNLAVALRDVDAIYLHPDAVGRVDPELIRAAYREGATVVAIDTLLSELSTLLDEVPPFDDLRPMQEGITMAMYHNAFNPTTQEIAGGGAYAEYHQDFGDFPSAVNEMLRLNGKDPNR